MLQTSAGRTRYIAEVGVIAALYAALTIVVAPISYGPLQIRISEALCVLPYFTGAAVPGLFIGCLIANGIGIVLGSSLGLMDVIVGSLTTLAAAYVTSKIHTKGLVPLPAVLFNAALVPWTLQVMLGLPYWFNVLWVGAGQLVACYGLGYPLLLLLNRRRSAIFGLSGSASRR
ncbi:MAG: QueT transporter family protein [Clostridia bacterium]|nr:QueT transporter family protein [Clostridia bacterium]